MIIQSNRSNAFAVPFCCSGARDLRRESSTYYCFMYFLEIVRRSILLITDDRRMTCLVRPLHCRQWLCRLSCFRYDPLALGLVCIESIRRPQPARSTMRSAFSCSNVRTRPTPYCLRKYRKSNFRRCCDSSIVHFCFT
jgi:hypothetical protein